MTTKAAFSPEEWKVVLEGPPTAVLRENGLGRLRNAVAVLKSKATTEELDDYRRFVLTLGTARGRRRFFQERFPFPARG
jgi:hypothetical protein